MTYVEGIQDEQMELATKAGVVDSLRHRKHLFEDSNAAVAHARAHIERLRAADRPPTE